MIGLGPPKDDGVEADGDDTLFDDWAIVQLSSSAEASARGIEYLGPGHYIRYLYSDEFTGVTQGPFDTAGRADDAAHSRHDGLDDAPEAGCSEPMTP